MAKIKIGPQIVPETLTNCFKLEIDWMHGDGDGESETIKIIPEGEEDYLLSFVQFLDELVMADVLDRTNINEYINEWLADNDIDPTEFTNYGDDNLEWDMTSDGQVLAYFNGITITKYDAAGNAFEVEIEI